jgi:hypothetical protein
MLTVTVLLQFSRFTWSLMDTDVSQLRRNLHNSHGLDFQTQTVESWHQDTGQTLRIVKEILFPIAQHITTKLYPVLKLAFLYNTVSIPRLIILLLYLRLQTGC